MKIITSRNESTTTVTLTGKLDTLTAPQLEAELNDILNGTTSLIFDFAGIEYVSSSGLRVVLLAQKLMNKQGTMVIKNVDGIIRDVFEVTGFSNILTIE